MACNDTVPQVLLESWNEAFRRGVLCTVLEQAWAENVPKVFSHEDPLERERLVQCILLDPLERFLTKSLDADEAFKHLKANDDSPLFCGRAFRSGEPTYSCRVCASDPTCVLCMQCFEKSAHRKHKYKINTSSGGGYCDCGDSDAWKSNPACEIHSAALNCPEKDPLERFPSELRHRVEFIMDRALDYSYNMLISDKLPDKYATEYDKQDVSCTMLYNDEVHTYDQVIQTLTKAKDDCTAKEAVEYATTVDREGRMCVHKGPVSSCTRIAALIQQRSRPPAKPLQVKVMHYTVVAHQDFALRLLKWLELIIGRADALRRIFCRVSMQEISGRTAVAHPKVLTHLEKILLADVIFWKAIRLQSHQLFMSGVFKDPPSKTLFAVLFTKHYSALYRDFVRDDHYRSVSATAVTVQIYTVSTIAKVLITKHKLIEVIIATILNESKEWTNDKGTLVFQGNTDAEKFAIFKRVQFALYDLKYALGCVLPNLVWTEELKTAFLSGLKTFLQLLSQIQGMDATKRYVTQHIEFEAEWETAFNLQLKLHDCITLMIQWCCSDREVLIAAYKYVLSYIPRQRSIPTRKATVANHVADCYDFDVGAEDKLVSIHLPLHRFLAGLNNQLRDLRFCSAEFSPMNRNLELYYLLEFPLRVQVLIAQIQADMWKRNGYSILNQIYYYQNVKCRQEMYDRDIQLIQAVAALMEPNEFLVHVINKFNLTPVLYERFDEPGFGGVSVKQSTALMDEMLNLLLVILGERYCLGVGCVTKNEIVQREIIHQLAITRMSHSDLDRNLAEDQNHETNIEENVREVADFTRTEAGKGMYSLKQSCTRFYNPCFYHYTKAERSKAEDFQRSQRRTQGLNQVLAVPPPPRWMAAFKSVSSLFVCDVMMHILQIVMHRMLTKHSRSRSESHLERVLHIITLALHEDKMEFETENKSLSFVKTSQRKFGSINMSIVELLDELKKSSHISHEPVKDLVQHVALYFDQVSALGSSELLPQTPLAVKTSDQVDVSVQSSQDKDRQKKAAKAALIRQKMIDKMSKMQKKFMKDNSALFDFYADQDISLKPSNSAMDVSYCDMSLELPVALGKHQTPCHPSSENYVCILCQEASDGNDSRTVVYSAYIQRSTVLSQRRVSVKETRSISDCLTTPADLNIGSFATTCGHPMHASCWQGYFESVALKEARRRNRTFFSLIPQGFDVELSEFLCPLCESVANTVLPILPNLSPFRPTGTAPCPELSFSVWLAAMTQLITSHTDDSVDSENCPGIARLAADAMYTNFLQLYEYLAAPNDNEFSQEMTEMMLQFVQNNHQFGLGVAADAQNKNVVPMIWNTTAYTIQVLEQLLRSDGKPLFGHLSQRQENCISLLVRFASVCHKVLPTETIKECGEKLLAGLLIGRGSIEGSAHATDILSFDAWHYLVSLCFAISSLFAGKNSSFPVGSVNDQYLLQLLLVVHVTQILLLYKPGTVGGCDTASAGLHSENTMETDAAVDPLVQLYISIHKNLPEKRGQPLASELEAHVIKAVLPFLRCAALLFHNLTDVPEPPALHVVCSPKDEYSILSHYMALPSSLAQLVCSNEVYQLVHSWCSNSALVATLSSAPCGGPFTVTYPLQINQLVDLPEDYSSLINSASKFTCPNSLGSDESRTPTLCLVCGQMLCSQSYCCQVEQTDRSPIGAATAHALTCGAGNSLFLRVRQCQVLLLSGKNKGCFMPAPYVDDYGETDVGLRRGNPMHLYPIAFRDLHRLWLSHAVPEKVSRHLATNSGHNMMVEWFHL